MNTTTHTYWRKLADGRRSESADRLLLLCLTPFAWLYSSALRLRALLYRVGLYKTNRLPRPVISIGNITVGGTGKTPVTAYIARLLLQQGYRVAVLSRGYGGALEGQTCVVSDGVTIMLSAGECGDEPYLLASTVTGLMVVIGSDRYAAGQMAMQQLAPDVFLLDDGFQHLRLHRDLNILLQDFSRPVGNGLTLPAGILREPASATGRADLTIFTRAPEGAAIPDSVNGSPACISHHTLAGLVPLSGDGLLPFSHITGHSVLAFAGIADPESFFHGLRNQGLNVAQTINFPDHVAYTAERCAEIVEALKESGAEYLVTTEKDGVKLKNCRQEFAARTVLVRLELTLEQPEILEKKLMELLNRQKGT